MAERCFVDGVHHATVVLLSRQREIMMC